jgi:ATP-dependent HslUV protease ATP-binding subunit HslU
VVEDISFQAPHLSEPRVRIDSAYARGRLEEILQKEDLSRFIL